MTSDWVEGQIAAYELNKAVILNYLQSIFPYATENFEVAVGDHIFHSCRLDTNALD